MTHPPPWKKTRAGKGPAPAGQWMRRRMSPPVPGTVRSSLRATGAPLAMRLLKALRASATESLCVGNHPAAFIWARMAFIWGSGVMASPSRPGHDHAIERNRAPFEHGERIDLDLADLVLKVGDELGKPGHGAGHGIDVAGGAAAECPKQCGGASLGDHLARRLLG